MRDEVRRAVQRLRYELAQGCGPDADRALDVIENELTTAYTALPRVVGEDAPQRATLGERIAVMDAAIVQRGLRIEQLEKLVPPIRPVPELRVTTAPEPDCRCTHPWTDHSDEHGGCCRCTCDQYGAADRPAARGDLLSGGAPGPELSVPSGTVQSVTAPPAEPPRRDGHVELVHPRGYHDRDEFGGSCQFCDGGLFACTVCGSFEGATTDMCPGERMTPEQMDAVYEGTLNYRLGGWRDECALIRMDHDVRRPGALEALNSRVAELYSETTEAVAGPASESWPEARGGADA